MLHKTLSERADHIGMTASIICAVHCAAVPVLLTTLPLAGLGFLGRPWFEWGMIILALLIGGWAIGRGFLLTHHKLLPVVLLFAGFIVIISGHIYLRGWREAVIVPLGGVLIAAAHFFNNKYAGSCIAPIKYLPHEKNRS